jgi:hypothetical protein
MAEREATPPPMDLASRIRREGHELRDLRARAAAWAALSLGLTLVLSHLGLSYAFRKLTRATPEPVASSPPAPRLQARPREDLQNYLKKERARLESYGWVDRRADVARIPIERAMELVAQGKRAEATR